MVFVKLPKAPSLLSSFLYHLNSCFSLLFTKMLKMTENPDSFILENCSRKWEQNGQYMYSIGLVGSLMFSV